MEKRYFPLFIDISEKSIVVIGGGKVAQRRVETLLRFIDSVKVVAPEITERLSELKEEGRIVWVKGSYHQELLEGADLVLAATNDAVCNERTAADCRKKGILVNAAHKKELCDFYFPAVAVKENVVAGITASGLNHTQARQVREEIETTLENIQYKEEEHGERQE